MREEQELKSLRPEIFSEQITWNEIETFQNEVLRPILKYQHSINFEGITTSSEFYFYLSSKE